MGTSSWEVNHGGARIQATASNDEDGCYTQHGGPEKETGKSSTQPVLDRFSVWTIAYNETFASALMQWGSQCTIFATWGKGTCSSPNKVTILAVACNVSPPQEVREVQPRPLHP